ncbi:TIGR00153 family protein [Teredinibacter sp. KSP-S5-2]|uniref:TIGR00153 family protein n=1 Tax=Teredinibacter sp. KSP-S5-2 TaxID=3034506 RepID=UPI0029350FC7|nr:TIGR00153 family protein [Teredinibacter sp. KSP-S5-2]WNO08349.1 TIGR00153 family protein [Teredinibacter sp. KSP-S5-2]
MAIINPLENLFGKSPIKPMQEHMVVATQAAAKLTAFFEATCANDWDKAEAIQQEISELEHQADVLKKQLRLDLPKSLFLPVPRTDLLQLLAVQDKIANRAKDIAGIMLGRKMVFPEVLRAPMKEYVASAVDTSTHALKAIEELDELLETGFSGKELDIVGRLIHELDLVEHKTDELQIAIRSTLFGLEDELPPVGVMFMYRVIEWVGDLADRAQQVGSRLQLLLAK